MGTDAPKSAPLAPPLWQQLQACAQALHSVLQGRNHTQALAPVEARLRPGAQALLFAVLRQWGRTLAIQKRLVQRPPSAAVNALLCTGLALVMDEAQAMYPGHTLVSQLVEAAKHNPATRPQASFINACLRRFLRERQACMSATDDVPSAKWNLPDWWIQAIRQDHPQHWQTVLQASQQAAPMVVRVNTRQTTREALQADWSEQGIESVAVGLQGLMLKRAMPVQALPGFDQGLWSVQDAGAQLAAPLLLQGLQPQGSPSLRILDACAAPGGKTAHLLELSHAQVLALDIDALRCQRMEDNLKRLQLQAQVKVADAGKTAAWWDGQAFDAILLDAPCTASGIVRRHPDIPWLRRASDLPGLAKQQRQLLEALWPLLKPGGRMLYCTCSVFDQEGAAQIQAFLARNTQARMLSAPMQLMPGLASQSLEVSDNGACEHDGFFYALLERRVDA
jgi:16S rRNA (cytosine967-C5)-methyltransferase